MTIAARLAIGLAATLLLAGAAGAQEARKPVSTHCGGLLCDAYYSGVPEGQPAPTALPCRDFVCGLFVGRTPDQPVAAADPVPAAPEAAAKPAKVNKHAVKAAAKPKADKAAMAETTPKAAAAAQ